MQVTGMELRLRDVDMPIEWNRHLASSAALLCKSVKVSCASATLPHPDHAYLVFRA